MAKNYKLNEEIKQFIIQQKRVNLRLSCRGLAPLIKERFQINISKSLINRVIKENNLSGPVGRRRIKEAVTVKDPVEAQIARQKVEFMENGGFFFLKAADLNLGLILHLAEVLSTYFPGLSKDDHQGIIEALIYSPFFKNKKSLWLLMGREVPEENLTQYSRQLLQVPFLQLKEPVAKLGVNHNFNEINDLWQRCLLRLNSYIVHFFPPEYQFLDFLAMQERFYSLPARIERKAGLLIIQLFYPKSFFWVNDIIWQEGFSYAANRVNEANIFTTNQEQIWLSPQVEFPEGSAFSCP
ncbi:MAG: hypothetical protein Q8R31_04065 [Candidatus Omnitrophota bacterium]|nr:hypothetical protein [Candidatus Omnitrophota bacterium]